MIFRCINTSAARPLYMHLRVSKSKHEVELLSQAIDITNVKVFSVRIKFIKPGVWEYEVEAELTHEYVINRGTGHAYDTDCCHW
jgi:Xaa-Pro aminopeptidase